MRIKRSVSLLLLIVACSATINGQSYIKPNSALKSHETLEILSIEVTGEKTIISLSVENRIDGGAFCADRNIFIIHPDGSRIKLLNASGIPQCPDSYKFKRIGEKLEFILTFPAIKTGTAWIDLIEDCSDNCFSFYGITLNNDLNKRLDEAFSFAVRGENINAISVLKKILEEIDNDNVGIEGSLYTDLITLLVKVGDKSGAEALYKRMLTSKAPRLDLYLKNLNGWGIKF